MHEIIDMRSDTVTKPSAGMRRAMANAEVGDDVYSDDPTVNLLQQRCALLLGKEAALFVPTGTMSNAIAIKTHTQPGDEILLDGDAHSMLYELGLPASIAGVVTRQFQSLQGVPVLDSIYKSIHIESLHTPGTSLIVLENTHNRAGGTVIPLNVLHAVHQLAEENNIQVHLDGARLFNASVASGISVAEISANAGSVTFCLSKGLGCPVGSVLCGTSAFISRARRFRKMLGGGLRQAGILAAAGLYALDHNIDRLADDHKNISRLAELLLNAPGIVQNRCNPPTNMLYIDTILPAAEVCDALEKSSIVRCSPFGPNTIRFVTHLDVDAEDIEIAAKAIRTAAAPLVN